MTVHKDVISNIERRPGAAGGNFLTSTAIAGFGDGVPEEQSGAADVAQEFWGCPRWPVIARRMGFRPAGHGGDSCAACVKQITSLSARTYEQRSRAGSAIRGPWSTHMDRGHINRHLFGHPYQVEPVARDLGIEP
jgi:hypothetical protein